VDWLETQLGECEQKLEQMLYPNVMRDLLDTLPCVGKVLSAVLALGIGVVERFRGPTLGPKRPIWMLSRQQVYEDPRLRRQALSSTHG